MRVDLDLFCFFLYIFFFFYNPAVPSLISLKLRCFLYSQCVIFVNNWYLPWRRSDNRGTFLYKWEIRKTVFQRGSKHYNLGGEDRGGRVDGEEESKHSGFSIAVKWVWMAVADTNTAASNVFFTLWSGQCGCAKTHFYLRKYPPVGSRTGDFYIETCWGGRRGKKRKWKRGPADGWRTWRSAGGMVGEEKTWRQHSLTLKLALKSNAFIVSSPIVCFVGRSLTIRAPRRLAGSGPAQPCPRRRSNISPFQTPMRRFLCSRTQLPTNQINTKYTNKHQINIK